MPIRRVEEEMEEESSRESSTIDSDEEQNVQYIRRQYDDSSDESYTDSFAGEIACCFS